jgi:hypothetical protein
MDFPLEVRLLLLMLLSFYSDEFFIIPNIVMNLILTNPSS